MDLLFFLVAVVLLVGVGICIYLQSLYNSLVRLSHDVDRAWANVDTLLTQRREEAARLVGAVRASSAPTRGEALRARLEEPRARAGVDDGEAARLGAEQGVSRELDRLLSVAEHDPAPRVDPRLLQIQERIRELEEQIRHRREFYNQIVTINNARLDQFPDRLLAARAGVRPRAPFVASGDERADLRVTWDGASTTPTLLVEQPSQGLRRPSGGPGRRDHPAD